MLIVTLILFLLLTSLVLFFVRNRNLVRTIAVTGAIIAFIAGIYELVHYNRLISINESFSETWIRSLGISFSFGLDGLSIWLVMLTLTLVPIILLTVRRTNPGFPPAFYALILMMESALIGVFSCMDGFLFYIFWELSLIPIYFICGLWGGQNRINVTLKFFIYTMLGSLFMLVGLIWIYLKTSSPHSFAIIDLVHVNLSFNEQIGIFSAFFLAFAIKIPIFPFHSWQPDTYTIAPTAGSMLLAGLMAKMGLYGFIRFLIPVCKPMIAFLAPYMIPVALVGLIYGSIIAIRQNDIKRLIAYSSFAHVGLMAAVLFTLNLDALQGSAYQMLSHGINIVALFFVADIIYNRTQTFTISDLGGIAKSAPRFAIFFMIVMLGSVALPLTNGFIGEFLMLLGLAQYNLFVAVAGGLGMIFGAVYMFWFFQKAMYGEPNPRTTGFMDLSANEMIVAIPLVLLVILMGVYPKPILDIIKPALESILTTM